MSFVIDTIGRRDLPTSSAQNSKDGGDESEDDFQFIPFTSRTASKTIRSTTNFQEEDMDLSNTYFDIGTEPGHSGPKKRISLNSLARRFSAPEKLLENSVLKPGIEKVEALPTYDEGRRQMIRKRKMEREKTAGNKWFNMKAPEITEEMKNDLEILKMRSALDPKHFYKKNDIKGLPRYFQIGRVKESAADFYHSRIPKKMQKKTLVEELLADAEFQKSTKKRYKQIITEQQKVPYRPVKVKELKGKKKKKKQSKKLVQEK